MMTRKATGRSRIAPSDPTIERSCFTRSPVLTGLVESPLKVLRFQIRRMIRKSVGRSGNLAFVATQSQFATKRPAMCPWYQYIYATPFPLAIGWRALHRRFPKFHLQSVSRSILRAESDLSDRIESDSEFLTANTPDDLINGFCAATTTSG